MSKLDTRTAIHKAKELLSMFNIKSAEHIFIDLIAAKRGVLVREERILGADGKLATFGERGIITVNDGIDVPGKKRFVIAHELGHFELHHGKVMNINCTDDDFRRFYKGNPIEIEANYFAAELLMPEEIIRPKIEDKDVSKGLIEELSSIFKTSLTATSIRFVTLRKDYALVCSEDSVIKWFVVDFDYFPYPLNTTGKVHELSMAYEYFHGGSMSDNLFPVEQDAWFSWRRKGQLKELAIPLGKRYNQTLSFLYVEEQWD